jgi:thiol-disulfide isomerase/thioredoxin
VALAVVARPVVALAVVALAALLVAGCDAPAGSTAAQVAPSGAAASCLSPVATAPSASSPSGSSPAAPPPSGSSRAAVSSPPTALAASTQADSARSDPAASSRGSALPDLSLPCFAGGARVRLAALGRPAVLNLWASWCTPCRVEMPAIQRYATRAATQVTVVGVDTADTRTGAGSVIQDLGITYPNVYDERQLLLHGLGHTGLPTTLLVDAGGRVRHVYAGDPLTEASLAGLVHTYLGVA